MLRKAGVVLCLSFLPGTTRSDITLQVNLIFLLTFAFLLAQATIIEKQTQKKTKDIHKNNKF